MNVYLDPGAHMPTKAYETDGGWDLYSRDNKTVMVGGSAVFDTGVHISIPEGYAGLLVSKSGLNVYYGITSTGLIDSSYRGAICVKLYNDGESPYSVHMGDKISQLVIIPISTERLLKVDSIDELGGGERGNNGFGSSGR